MMRSIALVTVAALCACGTMTPTGDLHQTVADAPVSDEQFDPVTPKDDAPQTPGTQHLIPAAEAWRVDISDSAPVGMEDLFSGITRELAFEVLIEDPPTYQVRTAALVLDSEPAVQDPCAPSVLPAAGLIGANGDYALHFGTAETQLGQQAPWRWVQLTGHRDGANKNAMSETIWTGEILAKDLGKAIFGEAKWTSEDLADIGAKAYECDYGITCVTLVFPVDIRQTQEFVLEPLTQADVDSFADCL
jgi:hypothetical protein